MNDTLLELRGLTVNYGRGRRRIPDAVSDVSLAVAPGETVALVGESGSGKSTIGNVVLGLVPATAGTVRFDGEDITAAGRRRRRMLTRHIQPIFQDPYGSLNPSRTIRQTLIEPLLAHGRAGAAAGERIAEVLDRVGLPADATDRYPDEFSGGQRQRIAIARALVAGPRLIVCDEPTSALDLSIQAQVLNLLRRLQRESGIGYLFITHDLALIRHVADRVVVLYRGRVMETGPAARVTGEPQHPYTQALLAAAPVPDPVEQRRRRAAARSLPPVTTAAAPDGSPERSGQGEHSRV
ncbi:ABC transporter ATP-binding protein [Dactylosporangium fulvum]|uniref:ATP-binding cassette domain-containing protein n=1 Tax=Dactylosporangium fulvum TaxID=53359 RepID=A0ABY5W995_9ACTN|nr:ATP-binding cassette domain-containing protein [Dactylosporangium fulvum]UWP85243.1 ATP-binding cassette domain-containing protein [Dactylosporangium fulvum]